MGRTFTRDDFKLTQGILFLNEDGRFEVLGDVDHTYYTCGDPIIISTTPGAPFHDDLVEGDGKGYYLVETGETITEGMFVLYRARTWKVENNA